ncbi:RNA polymerase sigma factor [Planctomycetes bacterium Poly30]|uniref:RNA polymerase sigma factor n=2 Tax=Saltatorellus ferox TaxID=2528018 RepID=A0A518EWR8_9BACT|nr:RNA polymerase sigma factor [Planctomycetes bacterium Poly30]
MESNAEMRALDAAARGDTTLLGDLLSQHSDRLRRIAQARIDPRIAARLGPDDVLQEAFLDVARRIGEYLEQRNAQSEERLPFFLWVRLLTRQVIARLHREHLGALKRDAGREARSPRQALGCTTVLIAHQLASSHTTPTGALRRIEQREAVAVALERLSEDDREVLMLRHYEELSNQEIATLLGVTESGASMRHLRALTRLKAITADLELSQ